MKLFFATLITFFCGTSFSQPPGYKIYKEWTGFNLDSEVSIYEQMSDDFTEVYTEDSEEYHITRMRWIKHRLGHLLLAAPFDPTPDPMLDNSGCSIGEFSKLTKLVGPIDTEVAFKWAAQIDVEGYFVYHLDLNSFVPAPEDQRKELLSSSLGHGEQPEIDLTINTEGLHLFAINTRCSASQSDYTIIIVEKVIDILQGGYVPCLLFPEEIPQARLARPESVINMEVFPNLVKGEEVQINFELNDIQIASLDLFDANTGRLVKNIIRRQEVLDGGHNRILHMNGLPPGMYFVVLQTESRRIVKKIVKI